VVKISLNHMGPPLTSSYPNVYRSVFRILRCQENNDEKESGHITWMLLRL